MAAENRKTISSKELGDGLGFTDAQVRKDLAHFGAFGHPGVGYRILELIREIKGILGTDRIWNVVLVGAGNLGHALAAFPGFMLKGFSLIGIFDKDPKKIGTPVGTLEVQPVAAMGKFIREHNVRLAVIAVPASAAQDVADDLIDAGVEGILNFAAKRLSVPDRVTIHSVDLAAQLEQIAFAIQDAH